MTGQVGQGDRDHQGAARDMPGAARDMPGAARDMPGAKRDVPYEEGEALRRVMRQVPSPVSVVTASDGNGEIRGITIGSFTSASLQPPLLSFNISRDAGMYDLLTRADHFALHVLHEGQAHLSDRFAIPDMTGAEQFHALEYTTDAHGAPVLAGAMAVFLCLRHAVYDAGDHSIVLGLVTDIREAGAGQAAPCLFRPLVPPGRQGGTACLVRSYPSGIKIQTKIGLDIGGCQFSG